MRNIPILLLVVLALLVPTHVEAAPAKDTPPVDPGWLCVALANGASDNCPTPNNPTSPYIATGTISGGWSWQREISKVKMNCTPRPDCINDWPVYYRIVIHDVWKYQSGNSYNNVIVQTKVRGGIFDERTYPCGTGNSGVCDIVHQGIIPTASLPSTDSTLDFVIWMTSQGDLAIKTETITYEVYFSLYPFQEDCSKKYLIAELTGPLPIDPIIESPVGDPTDTQKLTTVPAQIYMIRTEGGPWQNGTDGIDRYNTAVSWDGLTWISLSDLSATALCVITDPLHPDLMEIYIQAPSNTFYIRVHDTAGAFANNIEVQELDYYLGLAFEIAAPPCESQFEYDPQEDWVASLSLPSTSTGLQATDQLVVGDWYAVEVASGTWTDNGGVPRVDMEYVMTGLSLPPLGYVDLAPGSREVWCQTEDGLITFVQASQIRMWLRVNDLDSNFANNAGTLGINIYHVTFTRSIETCESVMDLSNLVMADTIDARAESGKLIAISAGSGEIIYDYGLVPGAWYAIQTTGGPWGYEGSVHSELNLSYEMAVNAGDGWYEMTAWPDAECSVATDALGHTLTYFQVPANSGVTYKLRVNDTASWNNNFGFLGFELYEAINLGVDPPDGECDYVYDPDHPDGTGWVNALHGSGDYIYGLDYNKIYAIVFQGDEYYWQEQGGGAQRRDMEITNNNGSSWHDIDAFPGALCVFQNGNQQTVFIKTGTTVGSNAWKLRVNSTTFADNAGGMGYTFYVAVPGDTIDPWVTCMDGWTATLINSGEWIPVRDEEGVYVGGTNIIPPNITQGLIVSETYAVVIDQGPWYATSDTSAIMQKWTAALTSNNGSNWYAIGDKAHTDIYCAERDQIHQYWTAVFTVKEGQKWKIRVNDVAGQFTDNRGNLAYRLYALSGDGVPPIDPPIIVTIENVCTEALVRPTSILDIPSWLEYGRAGLQRYFAWCERHTNIITAALDSLRSREPLASVMEINTITSNVIANVDSYSWEGGGAPQTVSIFDVSNQSELQSLLDHFMPDDNQAFAPWEDGGKLVTFSSSQTPAYYYNCNTTFTDYLPSKLRQGVCYASAWALETGMTFFVQLSLDIGALFLLFGIIKSSLQDLIYMMTGVKPWTKSGAQVLIQNTVEGDPFKKNKLFS